ncbi:HAMP domain-containing histidine kinase [Pleurocapsales cyanobacterium LEGE 10410]|nr:HAMP domain-containing histidine kinase [Pleurocapsales cyanobacterium LEGE 10410]
MQNWLLQNLSDVLNRELQTESTNDHAYSNARLEEQPGQKYYSEKNRLADLKAQREWRSAIASVEKLLLAEIKHNQETIPSEKQGLIFSAPVPLLSHATLVSSFQSAVFTTDAFNVNALMPCRQAVDTPAAEDIGSVIELPLIPQDPIAQEQFCLILTANFGLVMVLGEDPQGEAKFHFSFDPLTLGQVWTTLRSRLVIANYTHLEQLDDLVEQFAPPTPDYRLVTSFSRELLQNLPDLSTVLPRTRQVEPIPATSESKSNFQSAFATKGATSYLEMELLQALTHEVRTPLTTIRTLTKLLLKRKQDFKPNVVERLQTIDRECTEQIERMELIFRAAELQSTPPSAKPVELVPFPLEQVFQQSIPRWQAKAKRRNVDLDFTLPQQLPKIVSDPGMLDTVLTGLMESCTRSLPTGGHIDVKVSTAGDRLKLQVLSQASNLDNPLKSLGQLLTFQPATGCLSLNLDVTKNIFQALGGKLTVRQRQEQGKELTIFLPLNNSPKNSSQELNPPSQSLIPNH